MRNAIKNAGEFILKMLAKVKMVTKKNTEDKEDHNNFFYDKLRNVNIKYFQLKEFDCKCKECKGLNSGENMDLGFLIKLDNAREIYGYPMKISSGVRCENHNKAVKGTATSSHMNIPCNAADIEVKDSRKRYAIVKSLLNAGFLRIGIGKNFIHCDTDKTKPGQRVIWLYN
jgi:hypothetical protein